MGQVRNRGIGGKGIVPCEGGRAARLGWVSPAQKESGQNTDKAGVDVHQTCSASTMQKTSIAIYKILMSSIY